MTTRLEKRKIKEAFKQSIEFFGIMMKFFSGMTGMMKNVKDHRNQAYIKYFPDPILLTLVVKQASGLKSMRRMED